MTDHRWRFTAGVVRVKLDPVMGNASMQIHRWPRGIAAAITLVCVFPAAAQKYPEKTIRYISPFPTGASQILALLVSEKLGAALGQPVYADFRPGAGGNIGLELAAKSPPDGYTLVQTSASMTIGPSLYKKLGFNALRDFQAISQTANVPNVLVIHPSVPAKTVSELVKVAKANPGKLSYGSGGVGSSNHLASEMFKSLAGINLVHVPYKGASIALTHILSGEIDVVTVTVPATIPFINGNKLRGLAVLATERVPTLPTVPTSKEAGYPALLMDSWYGVMAPAGVRADIVERLNSELRKVMHAPETVRQLYRVGIDVVTNTAAEFQAFFKADTERWAKVIKDANIRID
jgi:tripartite-type tricarboxylate transporter receptor subunit TctC